MRAHTWTIVRLVLGLRLVVQCAAAGPNYRVDGKYIVDGQYRGRFTPDAEYVLSGEFAKLFQLPPMPYRFLTAKEGYRGNVLSKVPPGGVHPRVLMSPSDIEAIRAKVALGDKADRYFRVVWNDTRKAKPLDHIHGLASSAIVALVTEDQKLGRELAGILVEQARFFEPMADIMNSHPDMAPVRDNWYYYARTTVKKVGGVFYRDAYETGGAKRIHELAKGGVEFSSDSDRQSSGHLFNTVLRSYDYIHPFMTDDERTMVRRVIAKLTSGRYTAGMELPGNMFINNHMSMGEDLLILALAIEGEEGYDPRILDMYGPAVNHKITYDVSQAGHLHEKCKGFLPERAALAITRRTLPLLSNDHLRTMVWAKVMDSTCVHHGTPELGKRDQAPRHWWMGFGSGPWMDQFFNWAFLLKYVYPNDPVVDYFYKGRMVDQGLGFPGADPATPLPSPRIRYTWREIMLLTATDGLRHPDGRVIDYDRDGLPKEILAQKKAWVDLPRGVAMSRSSWDKDGLHIHYECRSDVYSAGHETPEAGDFNLVSHGVQWSIRRDWYMDCYFRNMVLIDGYAGVYSPVCGKLMAVEDNEHATTFISDQTDQYNWRKIEKNFYSWHKLIVENPWEAERWPGGKWGRDWEVPFQKHMREYQEGIAGLDWGNWHGETRGPEMYQRWNRIDHVFRTLHMTKGEHPYVLIVDDVRKDAYMHQYDWLLHLEPDVTLWAGDSSVKNRHLEPGMPNDRTTDLVLCLRDVAERRHDTYGLKCHREPKNGDPLLLVRVLWRNSQFAFPQPAFEQGYGAPRVKVPATAVDPEFRVLLFPFRHGEKKPITFWNEDRTQLSVSVGGHTDVYQFGRTDRERTLLTMARDGEQVTSTPAGPPRPELDTPFGWTPDRNEPDAVRTVICTSDSQIRFRQPPLGMFIRYEPDGSDPTAESWPYYTTPITVHRSVTIRARTFARHWPFAEDADSETLTIRFEKREPVDPIRSAGPLVAGLACEVFEIHQTIFDKETGIFTGKTGMLPELSRHKPVLTSRIPNVEIPRVAPQSPPVEMDMGFFRYSGFLTVPTNGVYGFRVNSCGPVVLKVGGQEAISVTGVYGLSQKDRFGEAALKAGAHSFELIVCDPVLWKAGREGPYEISLAMLKPGEQLYDVIPSVRFHTTRRDLSLQSAPEVPKGDGVAKPPLTVPGLVMNCYDRTSLGRNIPYNGLDPNHMRIASGERPYSTAPVLSMDASDNAARLVEYHGYLMADLDGVYAFQLDPEGGNLLVIDGHAIARNRLATNALPGEIELSYGPHTFSLRLAQSRPLCRVRNPGSSAFVPVQIGMFARPSAALTGTDGRLVAHLDCERLSGDILDAGKEGVKAVLRFGELVDDGKFGKAIKLGGGESGIIVENLPSPDDAFTAAFWIRIDKSVDRGLLDNSWGSHPGARLRHYTPCVNYFRGSGNADCDLRKFGANKGQWIHIAMVYTPTRVELHVNGELQSWQPKTDVTRNAHVEDIKLFSGQESTVDEIRLYNKALTEADIAELAKPSK